MTNMLALVKKYPKTHTKQKETKSEPPGSSLHVENVDMSVHMLRYNSGITGMIYIFVYCVLQSQSNWI